MQYIFCESGDLMASIWIGSIRVEKTEEDPSQKTNRGSHIFVKSCWMNSKLKRPKPASLAFC